VAAGRCLQAQLLLRVGRGEPGVLDDCAGDAGAAQVRAVALGGAVIFGTAVGSLRVVFGRHFVSDIVFAGIITIAIVFALYRLLLDPLRRNDPRLERGVERVSIGLHRGVGALLGGGR
jgi:lipid A 4'-phosphatase